jgi:hypothetical protein
MPTLHLQGPLGTEISIEVEDKELLNALRKYGKQGWTSGELPAGGIVLPYSMADTFDFSLIGGHEWTSPDGEDGVIHKGQFYKRRELEGVETKKMKMPPVVKYSRGARPTDPAHLKEGEEGGVQYVTLMVFRGNGRALEQYNDPRKVAAR